MNRVDAENEMKLSKALVCSIPLHPSHIVTPIEFQKAFVTPKGQRKLNKGEMLRVALRTLSSMGYMTEMAQRFPDQYNVIREYIQDYPEKP